MPNVHLDIVDGSGLVTLKNGVTRDTRIAFVDDIQAGTPAAVKHMAIQAGGMPRRNDPHPVAPDLRVVGFDVRPTGPDQAFVTIIYEGRQVGGVQQERLAVRDTSSLAQLTTQRMPDGTMLRVWIGADKSITPKIATVSYPVPMRNRILYGLFSSPRPESWRGCIRKVNSGTFENLPTGYWLCTYYDEQWSDTDRKFRVTIGFTTMTDEDWSTYWFIRGADGNVADVPEGTVQSLVAKAYTQGIVHQTNGILKVGFYDTEDFQSTFGSFITRVPSAA